MDIIYLSLKYILFTPQKIHKSLLSPILNYMQPNQA